MSYPIDDSQLGAEENLLMKPFHFEIEDNFRNRGNHCIHMWCKSNHDPLKTFLLRVNHFPVSLCIELPNYTADTQEPIPWTTDLCAKVYDYFVWCMNAKKKDPPYSFRMERKHDIYYFSPIKKSYLYFFFQTEDGMKATATMCSRMRNIRGIGNLNLICHEKSVNSIRKMMSLQKCSYSQWFNVTGRYVPLNYEDRASTSKIEEYFIDWQTITPVDMNLHINPTIAVFDIETYSTNFRAMPSSYNLDHCIYLISIVFSVLNQPETKKKICIIFGNCNEVEDATIIRTSSEIECLNKFAEVIQELDPDLISGYNIFGYDFSYMINRYNIYGIPLPPMGRIINRKTNVYDKTWASSAYGKNSITFIVMEGRIPVDLYPNIKRLFKLRKYNLDFVSKHFLGRGKHDVSAREMFEIYANSLEQNPKSIKEMTKVLAYCIEDSNLVLDLFDKVNIWYHLSELSAVSGVRILDLFISGEQIRCYSQIYNQCYLRGFALSNPRHYDYYYSGAYVADPIKGLHEHVLTFDFSSLYPSIMQAYNLCYTMLIFPFKHNTIIILNKIEKCKDWRGLIRRRHY